MKKGIYFAILNSQLQLMINKRSRWGHRLRSWISLNITSLWW
jgi:hypothetical protein